MASLFPANPIDPIGIARYSDATGTVVCGVFDRRTVCIRHPTPVRFTFALTSRRRADSHPVRGVALGPLPGDERHAAAYEFRFPEGTAHARSLQRLAGDEKSSYIQQETHSAPASAPALPTVPAPPWATTEERFDVEPIGAYGEPQDMLDIGMPRGEILCNHPPSGWRCFPPILTPSLAAVEPEVPPQDRRLHEWPIRLGQASAACTKDNECTLLLKWYWQRQRIAHTWFWDGSFVTIHRIRGEESHLIGRLRTGISVHDNDRREFFDQRNQRLTDASCLELIADPPGKNSSDAGRKPPPPMSPYAISPPGKYCIGPTGLCRAEEAGSHPDGGLPACPR